jgi:hypothetical protein
MALDAPIRSEDRSLLVSSTGLGKSTLASYLFSLFGCQRCLIDPKAEWIIRGAVVCRSPEQLAAALDSAPVVHYVPARLDREELEAVYEVAFEGRRNVVYWSDELGSVCVNSWAPRYLRLIDTQGRGMGIGHLQCAQRPHRIPLEAISESQHIFVFEGGLMAEDLNDLAREFSLSLDELRALLAELPPYGYLWWQRRTRRILVADPLPPELLRQAQRFAYKRP